MGERNLTIRDGWNFAGGVALLLAVAMSAVYILGLVGWGPRFDSSDSPPHRSGLRIATDNLTGCQYLRTSFSGITPRLDRDGKQVCEPR